ncbi:MULTISPECIES: RNA polymerase sigma factor [Niastella]|uniref:Sigma-70 family RNA polymerase sigma factor n=1 Tax=Niastella soli TaxID=2821487 RepID=A0ABS3Z0N3_9BACT|nr:sigma-70 family RNA polymerase sigma factor [Niastella soli]MBO9203718.1 sigma-70 family RNA polymerase sigma factor [Niastella soli]
MQDQRIIELIGLNKHDQALLALYKNFPAVRKMIRLKGGNAQDAEDVFQEALIILCRKVKETEFVLHAQLSTYLFSVCRFLWKDELKKRKKQSVLDFESGLSTMEEQQWEGWVEEEARIGLAEKVVRELGERCREVLLLFYNGGMKLKDIAAKMGYSSENTAKNQKYKCLEAAKNKLRDMKQAIQTI